MTIGALVAAGWRLGSVRGPVVPSLPFIDHVVAAPLDRATVLRERLVLTLTGGMSIGLVLGGIVAGGLVGSGGDGVVTLLVGVVGGAAVGLATALASVVGQAGVQPGRAVAAGREGLAGLLRGLRLEDLRRHAIRTTHVGGAVLAGDLRAARLDVAAPVTRARSRRLPAGGPRRTVVRRDLLGLRRAPGRLLTAAILTVPGAALAAGCLTRPRAPLVVAVIAAAVLYIGFGVLSEGVRLVADNAGTPPLLGLGFRAEALAHLVVPAGTFLVVALPTAALVALALGGQPWLVVAAIAVLAGLLSAATLLAAFRGSPPDSSFVPEFGPIAMTYWYARPLAVAAVSGGMLIRRLAHPVVPVPLVLAFGAAAALVLIAVGLALARRLELGHRV